MNNCYAFAQFVYLKCAQIVLFLSRSFGVRWLRLRACYCCLQNKTKKSEQGQEKTMHRLLLFAQKCFVLCISSTRSSLHRIHYKASDDTAFCVSCFQGTRIDAARCRGCRVSKLFSFSEQFAIFNLCFLIAFVLLPFLLHCRRAFQRFYQKFIETAYPVEDLYIDDVE